MRVQKYKILEQVSQVVELPVGAILHSVILQGQDASVYASVPALEYGEEPETERYLFQWVNTGRSYEDDMDSAFPTFLGTVQGPSGVSHLFYRQMADEEEI